MLYFTLCIALVRGELPPELVFAGVSAAPRVVARVYTPVRIKPETLAAQLGLTAEGADVGVLVDARTGKIVIRAATPKRAEAAVRKLAALEAAYPRAPRYRVFKCEGTFAHDAHEELLKRMPRDLRSRVVVMVYKEVNMLLVACGTDDWEDVHRILKQVNPAGEVLE